MKHKIEAKIDGERIIANVKFYNGNKLVHEINTAFPLDTPEEFVRSEVERQATLFELEKEQKKEQKKVDEKFESANNLINNLNS